MEEHISEADYLEELLRGTGRTTQLLKNCLPKALFVVGCESIAKNIRNIAIQNGRPDIEVIPYKILLSKYIYGRTDISEIVCDHFLRMTTSEWDKLYRIKGYYNSLTSKKILNTLQNIFK